MGPPLYVIIPVGIFGGLISIIVFGTFILVFSSIFCPNQCSCLKRFSAYQTASVQQTTTVVAGDGSVRTQTVGYIHPNALNNPALPYGAMHGQTGLAAPHVLMHGLSGQNVPSGVMIGQTASAPVGFMDPQTVPYGAPMGMVYPPMTRDGPAGIHHPPPYSFDSDNSARSSIKNIR